MSEQKHRNRLANEKSPYLLQHVHNPVDWYPWGDEAFEKARVEDKPIFLSIGYSTCHWCHVMERESFEDDDVARILNDDFIAIKVDREERPDVDHIYMEVCQMLTGSGGWPLTIIMTPDRKPFFAGTYFPKKSRMGMQGLVDILTAVKRNWVINREELFNTSEKIIGALTNRNERTCGVIVENILEKAYKQFESSFDDKYGGFRGAPKFPTPHNLYFLMRYWHMTKDKEALQIVTKTLDSMYKGGIYDHIGFGFSRYSTDNKWLVPHFEKMLYDNALLAIAYLEGYQATNIDKYGDIAEEIFTYVLRDMTSPEGGFYSAEDADSEGIEGKFYVWTPDEVLNVLGKEKGKRYCEIFDITDKGNFEGKSIPNLIKSEVSKVDGDFIHECRDQLFEYREKRIHPHKDDKILTAWNGLMIAAMALGGRILNSEKYTIAAERAMDFIYSKLVRHDGRLLARYREEAAYLAYADDYAFIIWALIELYETTFKPVYLQKAVALNKAFTELFWDTEKHGFFIYGKDAEQLLSRPKDLYDGATPSGNSVHALNLTRLSRLTSDSSYEEMAEQILEAFSREINGYPSAYAFALLTIQYKKAKSNEIVIVSGKNSVEESVVKGKQKDSSKGMIRTINAIYSPFSVTLHVPQDKTELEGLTANVGNYVSVDGKATAYVCEGHACKQPVTNIDELRDSLTK